MDIYLLGTCILFFVVVVMCNLMKIGNMHGMPVAFLLGLVENAKSLPSLDWFNPCLKPEDIVYIGLRDLDKPEKAAIKRLGIKSFTVSLNFIVYLS